MIRKLLFLALLLPIAALADIRYRSADPTSVIEDSMCIPELNGEGCLHVDEDVSGLIVQVYGDDGSLVALYDAGTEIEDISAIGTYAAPSASNVRVSPQAASGADLTQIMLADAVYASQTHVSICVSDGETTIMDFCRFVYLDSITLAQIEAEVDDALTAYGGSGVIDEDEFNARTAADPATAAAQTSLATQVTDFQAAVSTLWGTPAGADFAEDIADIDALIGTPVVDLAADIAAVEGQTDDIGVAGLGLTESGGTGDQFTAIAKVAALQTVDDEIAIIDGIVDSILVDTGTTLDTKINAIDDFIDTEIATLLAGVDVASIDDNTTAATQLALNAAAMESGVVEGTPTTTSIQTDLAETQNDIYIGRIIIFTSGAARGEATEITDYVGATGTLTVTALANAPAAGDTFVIL